MIDSLLEHVEAARARPRPGGVRSRARRATELVTLHRQSLFDVQGNLAAAVAGLVSLAEEFPTRLPGAPADDEETSPRAAGEHGPLRDAGVHRGAAPLGYLDFLGLQAEAPLR